MIGAGEHRSITILLPMLSIAPFPTKTWSFAEDLPMLSSPQFHPLYHVTDAPSMEKLSSSTRVEEEPLWYQPTDQMRTVPAEPLSRVFENRMPSTFQSSTSCVYHVDVPSHLLRAQPSRYSIRALENVEPPLNHFPRLYSLQRYGDKGTSNRLYNGEDCGYCRSVGKPSCGHVKTSCPELFALKPCTLCGADGYDNHTLMHCPSQQKIKLELKEEHRRRMNVRQLERIQKRAEIVNAKHSQLPFMLV
ncbi:Nanos-type domain-containing protein [Trichostrongylus colubriformis]|uniref:Nanos-type domain-containing protein n=1 Tax=Trichostrongylus colubriformis TaxID=6319 RepID=A0AAN8G5Z0_TRICO